MKIPKKIKIGGYEFIVTYHDTLKDPPNDNDECVGKCDYVNFSIKIINGLKRQQELTTFLHECLEAVNFVYGVGLKHKQIEALESAVFQLIQQIK